MSPTPEQESRQHIDTALQAADRVAQGRDSALKAECLLTNPILSDSGWRGELLMNYQSRASGMPPTSNARCGQGSQIVRLWHGRELLLARKMYGLGVG